MSQLVPAVEVMTPVPASPALPTVICSNCSICTVCTNSPFLHLYLLQKCFQQCQLCHWCQICQMFYLSTLGQINAVLCSLVLAGRFYFTIFWDVFRLNPGGEVLLQLFYIYQFIFFATQTLYNNVKLVSVVIIRLNQFDITSSTICDEAFLTM